MYRPPQFTDEARWQAYREAVTAPERIWSLVMTMDLDDGTHFDLFDNDIVEGSLVFKEQSTCSDGIMVGSAFSNSLDFSLMNGDGRFRSCNFMKAQVTATVKLYVPQTDEWAEIKLGTFYVMEAGRKYTTIPIKCLDGMCLLNRPLSDAAPLFPMSLRLLFQSVCLRTGIAYTDALYEQIPDITLQAFDVSTVTCRDFLSYLGCLTGQNLRMSRDNKLESFWYAKSGLETTPDTRVSLTLNDLNVHPTAVSVKDWNGSADMREVADTAYLLALEVNPLIQSEETAVSSLGSLTSRLTALRYRTYDCRFSGDPAIQAGDSVNHVAVSAEQGGGDTVESLVMSHEYRFRGTSRLAALGKTAEQDRQLTATAKKIMEAQLRTAEDLNDKLTLTQQLMVNQHNMLTRSMALYTAAKYNEQGQLVGYFMADQPIFDESGIIAPDDSNVNKDIACNVWNYSAEAILVSSDGYNGKYSGISSNSTILARLVSADMILTGVVKSQDETLRLDMADGTQSIKTEKGWGQTVLDGIGARFEYWNKEIAAPEAGGHPKLASLHITADANEVLSVDTRMAADLHLLWESRNGKMHTTVGHTILHDKDSSEVEAFHPFEIRSRAPVHISPGLYYDEALLFDNIVMRRTHTVPGNTGVDFLIVPDAIPFIPIPDGQVNRLSNPGFEEDGFGPWEPYDGQGYSRWTKTTDPDFVHAGNSAAASPQGNRGILYLPSGILEEVGLYDHPAYIGFWMKGRADNAGSALELRSGDEPGSSYSVHLRAATEGDRWQYVSVIVPALKQGEVLCLASASGGEALDDFCLFDAQGYTRAQWDDYVARRNS